MCPDPNNCPYRQRIINLEDGTSQIPVLVERIDVLTKVLTTLSIMVGTVLIGAFGFLLRHWVQTVCAFVVGG